MIIRRLLSESEKLVGDFIIIFNLISLLFLPFDPLYPFLLLPQHLPLEITNVFSRSLSFLVLFLGLP